MARTWSCMDHDKRVQLEALIRAGHSKKEMAALLGCHLSTIYRELKRGRCKQRDWHWKEYYVYSVAVADDDARRKRSNCGAPLKLGGNKDLAEHVERRIMEDRYSPAAVAAELRQSDLGYLCKDTIYRYIQRRIFPSLRPSHLPERGIRKRCYEKVKKERKNRYGVSIDARPAAVADRNTFGHWEMDCVIGKGSGRSESVLVMTERLTRTELMFKLPAKDSASVVSVLDRLTWCCSFPKIFKSITMDNGSEFSAVDLMEFTSAGTRRTYCYFCHPYTSCERGSNENANRLVRRWFPKHRSLKAVTDADCRRVARWMNQYPRGVLGWKTASEAFREACMAEGINISPYLSQFLS